MGEKEIKKWRERMAETHRERNIFSMRESGGTKVQGWVDTTGDGSRQMENSPSLSRFHSHPHPSGTSFMPSSQRVDNLIKRYSWKRNRLECRYDHLIALSLRSFFLSKTRSQTCMHADRHTRPHTRPRMLLCIQTLSHNNKPFTDMKSSLMMHTEG